MRNWNRLAMFVVLSVSMTALARPGNGGGQGDGDGARWGHGAPGGPGGPGFGICMALRDPALGVTEQQADLLKPLCRAQRDKMQEFGDSLADLRDAVRAELDKEAPDFDRVASLHQQMAALKTEKAREHVALRAKASEILTAEQQAKLKELRDAHRGQRGPRGRGHGGPGMGYGPCGGGGPGGGPETTSPDTTR